MKQLFDERSLNESYKMMLEEKLFCLSSFIVAKMRLLNLLRGFGMLFCSLTWRSISNATLHQVSQLIRSGLGFLS